MVGDPGIGKTRLTARFAAMAHAEGAIVLYGRADEDRVSPYQPFVEALRHYVVHRPGLDRGDQFPAAVTRELASLVPGAGPFTDPNRHLALSERRERSRHELFDAVVRLLLHAAGSQRLMLVLEDLHWADVPTLLLLRHLLRRGAGSPSAGRRDLQRPGGGRRRPAGSALADFRREAGMETIRLGGLHPVRDGRARAAHLGGDAADGDLAQRLFDQTGGNPFFIEELLHASTSAAARVARAAGRQGRHRPAPRSAGARDARDVDAGGRARQRFSSRHAAGGRRRPDSDDLFASLEAAVAARLILEDPDEVDRFSFTHALVRETLYERPIASRRLRLHRRVAVALEVAPLPVHPAELAHHYFQAREVGGAAKAIVYSLKAARRGRRPTPTRTRPRTTSARSPRSSS